jgi:PAS domain S-box-containing protein
MSKYAVTPTGRERPFGEEEIIVSKTDLTGRMTYVNKVFARLAQYPVKSLIGAPHSLIRHPDMPRSVFKLLWDRIASNNEIFAYVINMAKSGDHYWVFANVTPSWDEHGKIAGYHSNRRKPEPGRIEKIKPIYDKLLAEERRFDDRKQGMESAFAMLTGMLQEKGLSYDEFILTL